MSKDERIWREIELKFGRTLTANELAAMVRAATLAKGGAQKRRRAMRRAAYFPMAFSDLQ